jgi:hypothetical protein
MDECDRCEQNLPQGCLHVYGNDDKCPVGKRTDKPWTVGMAVFSELKDRRGIGDELENCEMEIQAEIIESIGKCAIQAMAETEQLN